MKAALATLIALIQLALSFKTSSQACTPDTATYTAPGIYPDSTTGIPPATEMIPYSIVITMIVPPDTLVDLGGGPQLVIIDSVVLVKIINQPGWLNYECDPPSCGFPGNAASCALFHGTPPDGAAGLDTVDIVIRQHGTIQGFPIAVPDTLEDFYVVEVMEGTGFPTISPGGVGFGQLPLPYTSGDWIEIVSASERQLTLELVDMQGKLVCKWTHSAAQGNSVTHVPESALKPGVYVIALTAGDSRSARVMITQ
jgi:hypothetical protein